MKITDYYQGFIFDLDGTLYRGEELIPGADKVINHLYELGKSLLFVTNKTTNTLEDYISLLGKNGIETSRNQFISATDVIKTYVSKHFNGKRFFAVAEATFIREMESAGLVFSDKPKQIDLVIVSLDRSLTLKKLEIASHAIENGARFIAANIDDTCPVEGDEIWDAGSTIAALEKRTHRVLEMHFGKPSQIMIDTIFSKLDFPKEKIILIGDRIETDIQMANLAGISSVLVKSGIKNDFSIQRHIKPDYIIDSVYDLLTDIPS